MWNPSEYNAINTISIPSKNVWIPDRMIVNTADSDGFIKISDSNLVTIDYTGNLSLIVPVLIRSRCDLNINVFPFDKQFCKISFTSWSNDFNVVYNLQDEILKTTFYIPNQIWNLTSINISTDIDDMRNPFVDTDGGILVYGFNLSRKSLFYVLNGMFPCFILNSITLLAFMFPYAYINFAKKGHVFIYFV